MQNRTERELVKACLDNNRLAQRELYDRYARVMMAVCVRYVGDGQQAQDVLQDAFVRVFASLETYKGAGSLEGWIRRIVVNTALESLRRVDVLRETVAVDDEEMHAVVDTGVLEKLSADDLMAIIASLPAGFRMVFNMYAIEGYSHKEIATELGITEGTSRSQYNRARSLIQKKLKEMNR